MIESVRYWNNVRRMPVGFRPARPVAPGQSGNYPAYLASPRCIVFDDAGWRRSQALVAVPFCFGRWTPFLFHRSIPVSTDLHSAITFSAKNAEKDVNREVDLRARQKMSDDRSLTYRDAIHAVFVADGDLHRAYLADIPPLHSGGARHA